MSEQSTVNTAKSLVQAYADKNWSEVWSLTSTRVVYDEPATRRKTHGIKRFMTILQEWGNAFPDSRISIKDIKSFGGTTILDLLWTGTHEGPIDTPGTILPTGKSIDLTATMVVEVGDGKAESVAHHFDMAAMEKQIELPPEERVA